MILFFNVLVTDRRYSTGHANRVDRLNLFKYALASYAVIPQISEVIVYCALDGGYVERETELRDYITALYSPRPVQYYSHSPSNQREWQVLLSETPLLTTAQPILYMGNDDHVFVDYDLSVLEEALGYMAAEPNQGQINTIHFTSWTEAISTVYDLHEFTTRGRCLETPVLYPDACQIVNSEFFRHLFMDLELGDAYIRRTDPILWNWYPYLGNYAFDSKVPHPPVKSWVPLRELVRHFDAYFHVSVPTSACPQLNIPPGFFEGKIRLVYCPQSEPVKDQYAWGPLENTYERKMLADLPLFWRSRIADIEDHSDQYSRQDLLAARNAAHRTMMTTPHVRGFQDPRPRAHDAPVPSPRYTHCPDNQPLDLPEEYVRVGYRTE